MSASVDYQRWFRFSPIFDEVSLLKLRGDQLLKALGSWQEPLYTKLRLTPAGMWGDIMQSALFFPAGGHLDLEPFESAAYAQVRGTLEGLSHPHAVRCVTVKTVQNFTQEDWAFLSELTCITSLKLSYSAPGTSECTMPTTSVAACIRTLLPNLTVLELDIDACYDDYYYVPVREWTIVFAAIADARPAEKLRTLRCVCSNNELPDEGLEDMFLNAALALNNVRRLESFEFSCYGATGEFMQTLKAVLAAGHMRSVWLRYADPPGLYSALEACGHSLTSLQLTEAGRSECVAGLLNALPKLERFCFDMVDDYRAFDFARRLSNSALTSLRDLEVMAPVTVCVSLMQRATRLTRLDVDYRADEGYGAEMIAEKKRALEQACSRLSELRECRLRGP